jgi:hypothetical protein
MAPQGELDCSRTVRHGDVWNEVVEAAFSFTDWQLPKDVLQSDA